MRRLFSFLFFPQEQPFFLAFPLCRRSLSSSSSSSTPSSSFAHSFSHIFHHHDVPRSPRQPARDVAEGPGARAMR